MRICFWSGHLNKKNKKFGKNNRGTLIYFEIDGKIIETFNGPFFVK